MTRVMVRVLGLEREIEVYLKAQEHCSHLWKPYDDGKFMYDKCEHCGEENRQFVMLRVNDE